MDEITVQDHIKFVQHVQRRLGFPTVLAGGAVRDLLHGLVPKDYDLFFVQGNGALDSLGFHSIKYRISTIADGGIVQEHQDYNEVHNTLVYVYKFEYLGRPFDVIELEEVYSPEDVVSTFDLNLNQVWLTPDGYFGMLPDNPIITDEVSLTMNPDRPSKERVQKLAERFPEYDWTGVFAGLELDYV